MNERERAAHEYADVGWPAFPCAPGAKTPLTEHGFQEATTDHRQISRWWSRNPAANVAIRTGAPGPDVVDVDVHESGNGFRAFNACRRAGLLAGYKALVRTPSTGMHLYFQGTGQRNGSIPKAHLDFRSEGGYVVAPPSAANGGLYVVVKHAPGDATVDWGKIRDLVDPPERRPQPRQRDRARDSGDVDRLVEHVAKGQPGNRNFPLYWASKQLELAGLLDAEAEDRLVDALGRADPGVDRTREARRTIDSGRRAAQRREGRPGAFQESQSSIPDRPSERFSGPPQGSTEEPEAEAV